MTMTDAELAEIRARKSKFAPYTSQKSDKLEIYKQNAERCW